MLCFVMGLDLTLISAVTGKQFVMILSSTKIHKKEVNGTAYLSQQVETKLLLAK
jgi:hypothetical protein